MEYIENLPFHQLYAVYNCSRKVLVILIGIFVLEVVATSLVWGIPLAASPSSSHQWRTPPKISSPGMPSQTLTGCFHDATVLPANYAPFIPPLLFESFLCLLMLYKAWTTYRDDSRSPLLSLLIRDRCVLYVHNDTALTHHAVSFTS